MKNRIIYLLLLSAMIASLGAPIKTINAAIKPKEHTLYSGIVKIIHDSFNNEDKINSKTEDNKTTDLVPEKQRKGWVIADCVNVRKKPTLDSQKIGQLYFNENVTFYHLDSNWTGVLYDGDIGYVKKEYISANKPSFNTYSVPYTSGNKTFMPHKVHNKSIFSKSSKQYKLQQLCYTGNYGIRKYKNRFCVALGSAFNVSIGQYFDLILENGETIQCIMADQKADIHTDSSNIITLHSGCVSEFIVDSKCLNSTAKRMGDISYCTNTWNARVTEIRVYSKCVDL